MDGSDKPLTNEDFRKLLATPRPGSSTAEHTNPNQNNKEKKKQHRRPPPPFPHRKHKQQDDTADGSPKQQYRDRAAERRTGMPQTHFDSNDLSAHPAHYHNKDMSSLGYDESKFLGGDLEHTHLVKGLDYALLSKIRSEQQQGNNADNNDATTVDATTNAGHSTDNAPPPPPTFITSTGRAIYNTLFNTKPTSSSTAIENFLPKRMAFIYTTHDTFEVPTTLYRAKEDCPRPPELVTLGVDHGVLQRLGNIMAYLMLDGDGRKKMKKKERQELLLNAKKAAAYSVGGSLQHKNDDDDDHGTTTITDDKKQQQQQQQINNTIDNNDNDNDEDDIFGDAGTDYVPERKKQNNDNDTKKTTATTTYFDNTTTTTTAADDNDTIPQAGQWEELKKKEQAMLEDKKREEERAAKRLQMLQDINNDGYAECYPEYVDVAGAVYDSDDDDDGERGKDKKGTLDDRGDKNNNNNNNKNTTASMSAKEAAKEAAKQQRELSRIQKIFEEKGYSKKHADAFGTNTAAAQKTKNSDEAVPKMKKRRI